MPAPFEAAAKLLLKKKQPGALAGLIQAASTVGGGEIGKRVGTRIAKGATNAELASLEKELAAGRKWASGKFGKDVPEFVLFRRYSETASRNDLPGALNVVKDQMQLNALKKLESGHAQQLAAHMSKYENTGKGAGMAIGYGLSKAVPELMHRARVKRLAKKLSTGAAVGGGTAAGGIILYNKNKGKVKKAFIDKLSGGPPAGLALEAVGKLLSGGRGAVTAIEGTAAKGLEFARNAKGMVMPGVVGKPMSNVTGAVAKPRVSATEATLPTATAALKPAETAVGQVAEGAAQKGAPLNLPPTGFNRANTYFYEPPPGPLGMSAPAAAQPAAQVAAGTPIAPTRALTSNQMLRARRAAPGEFKFTELTRPQAEGVSTTIRLSPAERIRAQALELKPTGRVMGALRSARESLARAIAPRGAVAENIVRPFGAGTLAQREAEIAGLEATGVAKAQRDRSLRARIARGLAGDTSAVAAVPVVRNAEVLSAGRSVVAKREAAAAAERAAAQTESTAAGQAAKGETAAAEQAAKGEATAAGGAVPTTVEGARGVVDKYLGEVAASLEKSNPTMYAFLKDNGAAISLAAAPLVAMYGTKVGTNMAIKATLEKAAPWAAGGLAAGAGFGMLSRGGKD